MPLRSINPEDLSAATAEQLARQAQTGCVEAFGELVGRFQERLYNFLLRRTGMVADAEDLTQDAFVRAWEQLDRYDDTWRFSTWLFTIAARLAVSHHRAESRRKDVLAVLPLTRSVGSAAEPPERWERGNLWEIAAESLTDLQHTALWLRYAEELSISEIATVLGKSNVAIRVTLFRARESLARELVAREAPKVGEQLLPSPMAGQIVGGVG